MRKLSYHMQIACSSEYLHVMTSECLISEGLSAADSQHQLALNADFVKKHLVLLRTLKFRIKVAFGQLTMNVNYAKVKEHFNPN